MLVDFSFFCLLFAIAMEFIESFSIELHTNMFLHILIPWHEFFGNTVDFDIRMNGKMGNRKGNICHICNLCLVMNGNITIVPMHAYGPF